MFASGVFREEYRMKILKKNMSALCIAFSVLICAALGGCKTEENKPQISDFKYGAEAEDGISAGTILHAWCWSFGTIKDSMADIAAAGYSAVQTSPANACIEGGGGGMQLMGQGKWYYQYQPTDWTIGNYQLGTEQEFAEMCAEAHRYGVKVIVDIVPNHTASDTSAVSQSLIDAAGGIDKLYHSNYQKNIVNYSSRIECTSYSLSGLPDVNTENHAYQDYLIAYLKKLIDDGADGVRYDAAKHIALPDDPTAENNVRNDFWERIPEAVGKERFQYGEVLQGDNDCTEKYIPYIGHVTASDYGKQLRGLLAGRMLNAKMLEDFMIGYDPAAVTWVESHDTYTDGSSLSVSDTQIILGWAAITARGDGTPLFFDRPYGGCKLDKWGRMNRIGAAGSPLYKSQEISSLNHFRNAMTGLDTKTSNISENKVLMTERGDKGIVLINYKDENVEIETDCALAEGEYTDKSGMNGTFTVSGGVLKGVMHPDSIAVIYNEGNVETVKMPSVWIDTDTFEIDGSLTVTLHVSGADSGEYVLNGTNTSFKDGEKLDILKGTSELRLFAKGKYDWMTVMTYYFTEKRSAAQGTEISFEKPDDWGDVIYAYVYDETVNPLQKNALWPGVEMTRDDGNVYSYTLDRDWGNALVIFSDGTNQYPAAMEPGMPLIPYENYYVGHE